MNRTVGGSLLGLLCLTGCIGTNPATATKTSFTLTSVHVAWLVQDPPEVTPSGDTKIRGWQHLWYDNADDDRLDGYNTVEANVDIDKNGSTNAWGTFTVKEKLDDLTLGDFARPDFDREDVRQGGILWQGTRHSEKDGGTATGRNSEGMTASYFWKSTANTNVLTGGGYILDPHGE